MHTEPSFFDISSLARVARAATFEMFTRLIIDVFVFFLDYLSVNGARWVSDDFSAHLSLKLSTTFLCVVNIRSLKLYIPTAKQIRVNKLGSFFLLFQSDAW
jgi:hypothetical protein